MYSAITDRDRNLLLTKRVSELEEELKTCQKSLVVCQANLSEGDTVRNDLVSRLCKESQRVSDLKEELKTCQKSLVVCQTNVLEGETERTNLIRSLGKGYKDQKELVMRVIDQINETNRAIKATDLLQSQLTTLTAEHEALVESHRCLQEAYTKRANMLTTGDMGDNPEPKKRKLV